MKKHLNLLLSAIAMLSLAGCGRGGSAGGGGGGGGERPPAGPAVSLEQFATEVEQSSGFVLVDFWAPWCPPCRTLKPIFEKVEPDYAGRIRFFKVDVDHGPEVAAKYKVEGIPTLILFKNGKPADQQVGAPSEKALRAWLDQQLAAGAGP